MQPIPPKQGVDILAKAMRRADADLCARKAAKSVGGERTSKSASSGGKHFVK